MSDQSVPLDINALSFDSFGRDARRDVVCLAPIRTVIRREEEIVLVRKVRKVEEIDAPLSCPATSTTLSTSSLLNQPSTNQWTAQPQIQYQPQAPATEVYQPTAQAVESPVQSSGQSVVQYQLRPPATEVYQPTAQVTQPVALYQSESSATEAYQPMAQAVESLQSSAPGVEEELIVDSRRNCLFIDPIAMGRLQHQTSISRVLQPGTYTIKLKSGAFDYRIDSGHPGEPIVLLWIYGGKVVNHKTGVEVGATWSSLNGYGDTLTLDVREPAILCGFFFDTYLDDNEGEIIVSVEGADYAEDLIVHSKRNCFYIDPETMRRLEQETSVSKTLQPGTYAIKLKSGTFGYRANSGFEGEPIVLLWLYGGVMVNHKTGVEVGATWSSLNGYGDTLTLDVREPITVCAFFYDTYLEDNQGEVILSVARI